MDVKTGSQFLSLCDHPSFVQKTSYAEAVLDPLLEPFKPLLPKGPREGSVYWSPGPDHYGLVELNGKAPGTWLFYRDNILLASDGMTLDAVIQTPVVERLWAHRRLPEDFLLLDRAKVLREEEIAKCKRLNEWAIAEVKKRAPIVYFSDTWRDGLLPLQEFPKRITIPMHGDVLSYLATYRKLPSLPWE